MRTTPIFLSLACSLLAACSTTPLPDDFSGKSTYDIVRKIRCEARDAVRGKAVALMLSDPRRTKTYATGLALRDGRKAFADLKHSDLDPETVASVSVYEGTTIGYQFTFDITETNDESGKLNLGGPLGVNVFSLELSAGGKLKRQNARTFPVTDNFYDLAINLNEEYCRGLNDGSNAIYPIIGDIGLSESIDTFIDLNQSGGLTNLKDKKFKEVTDARTFTTELSMGVTPKVEIKSAANRLKNASFTSSNSRIDEHKVVIALSLPIEPAAAAPSKGKKAPVPKGTEDATKKRVLEMLNEENVRAGYSVLRDLKLKVDAK